MEVVTARNKDPKKVAAGVAGAAARKKNHQAFLDKIRDAKPALLAGETVPAPVAAPERLSADVGTTAGSMSTWRLLIIVGFVGGGALVLLRAALRLSERRQVARATGTMQLKVERQEDIQPTTAGLSHPQRCLFTEFK